MGEMALVVRSKAQPGKRDECFALYQQMMAPRAEANDGQEVVVWCADQQDPDAFFLFEIYRDAEAFGANAQASWFGEFMAASGPLLAAEPSVHMGAPQWSKGV